MVLHALKSVGLFIRSIDGTTIFMILNFLYLAGSWGEFWEDFVRQYGLDYKIIISEDTKLAGYCIASWLISFTHFILLKMSKFSS